MPSKGGFTGYINPNVRSVDSDQTMHKKQSVLQVVGEISMTKMGSLRMYEQLKGCFDLDTGKEYTQK